MASALAGLHAQDEGHRGKAYTNPAPNGGDCKQSSPFAVTASALFIQVELGSFCVSAAAWTRFCAGHDFQPCAAGAK
jgi:hypothetical protein